jgi:hypothetical protein
MACIQHSVLAKFKGTKLCVIVCGTYAEHVHMAVQDEVRDGEFVAGRVLVAVLLQDRLHLLGHVGQGALRKLLAFGKLRMCVSSH